MCSQSVPPSINTYVNNGRLQFDSFRRNQLARLASSSGSHSSSTSGVCRHRRRASKTETRICVAPAESEQKLRLRMLLYRMTTSISETVRGS